MNETKKFALNPMTDAFIGEYENSDPNALVTDAGELISIPVRIGEFARLSRKMANALLVVVNTPHIQTHLREHDPKALEQCLDALNIW